MCYDRMIKLKVNYTLNKNFIQANLRILKAKKRRTQTVRLFPEES